MFTYIKYCLFYFIFVKKYYNDITYILYKNIAKIFFKKSLKFKDILNNILQKTGFRYIF